MNYQIKILLIYTAVFWVMTGIWFVLEYAKYGRLYQNSTDSIITMIVSVILTFVIAFHHRILKVK